MLREVKNVPKEDHIWQKEWSQGFIQAWLTQELYF